MTSFFPRLITWLFQIVTEQYHKTIIGLFFDLCNNLFSNKNIHVTLWAGWKCTFHVAKRSYWPKKHPNDCIICLDPEKIATQVTNKMRLFLNLYFHVTSLFEVKKEVWIFKMKKKPEACVKKSFSSSCQVHRRNCSWWNDSKSYLIYFYILNRKRSIYLKHFFYFDKKKEL